jgi:hypothetical protein
MRKGGIKMLKYSLLATGILSIVGICGASPATAGDDANTTSFTVSVSPDPAQRRSNAYYAAGASVAGDSVSQQGTYFSAYAPGDAVASDDTPTASSTANVASSATTQSACGQSGCDNLFGCLTCNPCPCLYADVEAVFMQQSPRFRNQPILLDFLNGTPLVSTSDINFADSTGVEATFGIHLCGCRAVEFGYFGLFRNGASVSFDKTDPNMVVTFPTGPVGNVFLNMDHVQTDYTSYLNSFEVDFPCCCGCCGCCEEPTCGCGDATCGEASCSKRNRGAAVCRSVEWFAGFRYIEIGTDLNITAASFPSPFTETGAYTVHTNNRLFGGQIGGRLRRTVNRFGYEMTGKVGIYGNDADQSQTVTDFPNFPLRPTTSVQANNVAFEGEFNLSAIFRITDVWSLKAGYSVIWIEGLALAPDQLDFNFATSPSGNTLSSDGGMFIHGANVGLEARW